MLYHLQKLDRLLLKCFVACVIRNIFQNYHSILKKEQGRITLSPFCPGPL